MFDVNFGGRDFLEFDPLRDEDIVFVRLNRPSSVTPLHSGCVVFKVSENRFSCGGLTWII